MSYIVSAFDQSRPVSFRRGSMMSALEQGLALLGCGMNDVWITDLKGRRQTPAEFTRALFDCPEAQGTSASTSIADRA